MQQQQAELEQARLEQQQQAAEQARVERPPPSLNEPMRVPIPPQQVAVGTNSCSSDLPPTKPSSPVPTWAQLPTMEALPSAMSEQLPTPSMQAMPPELPTAQVMAPELPTVHLMPAETVSETTVGAADPNLLAALGAQTLVAGARSMPQLPRATMGQQPHPFLLTLPSLDTTPPALETRELVAPPGLETLELAAPNPQPPKKRQEQQQQAAVGALSPQPQELQEQQQEQQPQEQHQEQQPQGSVGALSEAMAAGNVVVISPSWDLPESSTSLPESSTSSQLRPHPWPAAYTPP